MVSTGFRLLRRLLLDAQQLLQARKRIVARGFESRFALDLLPVHLDAGDEVGDFVAGVLCVDVHFGKRQA